ncbi:MAG: hypothetical protein AAGK32_16820, partial [Actinomycetota bacterium]
MSLRRHAVLLVLATMLLGACQVDVSAKVVVLEDGSGVVSVEVLLDEEAAAEVDDLDEQLRTDDLVEAGWEVDGPEPIEGVGVAMVATKPFASPEQAADVIAEIAGPDVLEGSVVRDKSFGRVEHTFDATVDLSGGIESFSDDDLAALLNDLPIGQDVAALEERLGAPLRDLTSFTVVAELPAGDATTEGDPAVSESADRQSFTWEVALGDPPTDLRARTREVDWVVLGLAALALVLLVVLAT